SYLLMGHTWADKQRTRQSYELFARYVMPYFQDSLHRLRDTHEWVTQNHGQFLQASHAAIDSAIRRHQSQSLTQLPSTAH
ncbi:MAG TPA: hypothetical protein VHX15_04345, partial [Frankiaceae bacterium]|nr:hypothetical protein [Frankiaceae bacterium]